MPTTLPIADPIVPESQDDLADLIRQAHDSTTPVYPIGGSTALDFGLPPKQPGWGISTAGINRLIDYPSRDMTITVEAGMTMAELAATLAAERQRLPIDVPHADIATIGGVVATNYNGPRRYGSGTVRDYVIGISGVDGRGVAFKGGGRVVKNVAGYDFCKLLTGSLGTLAVITQLTLKVRPLPESTALLACGFAHLSEAETALAGLITSKTTPSAIELLVGPAWDDGETAGGEKTVARLVVGLEGTAPEVTWMLDQLESEWKALGVTSTLRIEGEQAQPVWQELIDFGATDDSALTVKLAVRPSRVCELIGVLQQVDPQVSIQSHAGSGTLIAKFATLSSSEANHAMIQRIHPAAIAAGGSAIVWSSTAPDEMPRLAVWGPVRDETLVMQSVKKQFDPRGVLNPGRFIYA
jgi:glycolate oxidase FAD binding subunit